MAINIQVNSKMEKEMEKVKHIIFVLYFLFKYLKISGILYWAFGDRYEGNWIDG